MQKKRGWQGIARVTEAEYCYYTVKGLVHLFISNKCRYESSPHFICFSHLPDYPF